MTRARSEIFLRESQLLPGVEATIRQTLNAALRQRGLWDKLAQREADMMSAADGCWNVDVSEVPRWSEQVRLLRWVLGIDAELMPLAHFPPIDFSLAHDLLARQDAGARPSLRAWDLRVQRDIASEYMARVIAELAGRHLIAENREIEGWADQVRQQMLGPSRDYLAGKKTVGELSDTDLKAIVAYLKSLPPIRNHLRAKKSS